MPRLDGILGDHHRGRTRRRRSPGEKHPVPEDRERRNARRGGEAERRTEGIHQGLDSRRVAFHEITGFTSTALFAAAGVIGVVHFLDMMSEGHRIRDQINYQEGAVPDVRPGYVEQAWGSDSALRWWHVGLLIGGEALYLGDAITGVSMWTKGTPGKFTKHDLHKVAFFTHAGLMIAQIVLGFLTTDALSRGDHDTMIALGAAHAAVGVAIPVVMLGAGLENIYLPE